MAGRGAFAPSGFGERLKAIREAKGWTQKELAERSGTHTNTIARLERGEQEPNWPMVISITTALGVDCTAFTGGPDAAGISAPAPDPPRPVKKPGKRG